jgi:septal ring factor EnvC (AmiA/AmiB activator)
MLGASGSLVRKIFSIESFVQGLTGAMFGIILLVLLLFLISNEMNRPLQVPVFLIIAAFSAGPFLAVLANWLISRKALSAFSIALLLLVVCQSPLRANELDSEVARYQKELERLSLELQQNQSVVTEITEQERTLIGGLEKIEKEIDLLEKEHSVAVGKKTANKAAIHVGQKQLSEYERKLVESRRELERWLRELCVQKMPSVAEVIFFDIPHSELIVRNKIIDLLAQKEAEAHERTEEIRRQYVQQEDDLRKRSELDTLYIETNKLRVQQLLEKKRHREDLLNQVRQQKTIYLAAINDLEASSRNLEQLIRSSKAARGPAAAPVPFQQMKGLLPWPVTGEVAAPFGRIQNPDSHTYTRHMGIDISSPLGAEISVIHDGAVVYSDWFRGYGKLIILDHGDGYSSVYAHCSEIFVKKGEFIGAGTVVGLVGETGSLKGPYLYFEIRENGQPVDPLVWLQRRT